MKDNEIWEIKGNSSLKISTFRTVGIMEVYIPDMEIVRILSGKIV